MFFSHLAIVALSAVGALAIPFGSSESRAIQMDSVPRVGVVSRGLQLNPPPKAAPVAPRGVFVSPLEDANTKMCALNDQVGTLLWLAQFSLTG
jgi:hypothetical protein